MSAQSANESLVRAVCQGLQKCTPEDVEPAIKFFAPNVVFHMWGPHEPPLVGKTALLAGFKETFKVLKDFQIEIINVASHDNVVFLERVERMLYRDKYPVRLYMAAVAEVGLDGMITSWKDYFDPTEIKHLEASGAS